MAWWRGGVVGWWGSGVVRWPGGGVVRWPGGGVVRWLGGVVVGLVVRRVYLLHIATIRAVEFREGSNHRVPGRLLATPGLGGLFHTSVVRRPCTVNR